MDVDVMPLSRGWSYILHISFRTWQRDHSTRLLQSLTNSAGRPSVVPVDGWIKERASQPDGSMGVKALSPVKRCRFGTSWLWKALGMIENDRLKEKPRMWPNCGKEENNIDPYEIKRRNQKEEKTSGVTIAWLSREGAHIMDMYTLPAVVLADSPSYSNIPWCWWWQASCSPRIWTSR